MPGDPAAPFLSLWCDDVPYAASYESAGNNGDFSARMIPGKENGRAGSAYLGFMIGFRIKDAQVFLVTVEQ